MSRVNRRAARIDANQPEIVKALRDIPGVTVELGHDDFICGYKGVSYWIELKVPGKEKKLKPDQIRIRNTFTGCYIIASTLDQILEAMGI
jgi:hypothetical protein